MIDRIKYEMKQKSVRFWLTASLIWASLIFIGTSLPTFSGPHTRAILGQFDGFVRTCAHLCEFFILSFVLYGIGVSLKLHGWKNLAFVLSIVMALAFSDEIHQVFVAGRSYKLIDIGKDLLGASFALIVVRIPLLRRKLFNIRPKYRRIVYYA